MDEPYQSQLCTPTALLFFHLFVTLGIKVVLTICTFGSSVPAGVFVPSMAIGALAGRMVGIWMQSLSNLYPHWFGCYEVDCVVPGTYAILGAAASLAGVTRMTVSLTVIMFELTGAVSYILPTMMTVVIAKWVGELVQRHSIYDNYIRLQRYPYFSQDVHTKTGMVQDIMTKVDDLITITNHVNITYLERIVKETKFKGFPVSRDGITMGYVDRNTLVQLLSIHEHDVVFSIEPTDFSVQEVSGD
jgi:chloride channel 3/4/5